jgi:hypothetical protein
MVLPEDPAGRGRIKRDFAALFRSLGVAEVGFGLPTVMGRDYAAVNDVPGFACPDIFRRLFVFRDGVAGPCCGDWERRLVMGDAGREGIAGIWGGEAYAVLRAAHREARYRDVPACRSCSVPYLSAAGDP